MMRLVRRSYFTLLELMVVLFIISLGLALTGVKIKGVYEEQRFLSESQQILSHLAMAQDLMLIMDADVQVRLIKDPESRLLTFWIEVEKPLEKVWAKFIERKVQLRAIQSYTFSDSDQNDLTLQFSLGHMSKGILTLYEGNQDDRHLKNKREFQIELVGYPSPLTAALPTTDQTSSLMTSLSSSRGQHTAVESQSLYPIEMYKRLYEDPNKKNTKS